MSKIGWIKLAKLPLKKSTSSAPCGFSEAIQINANEFIVAPFTTHHKGIYKYQTNNQWKLFAKYPKDLKSTGHTLSYDSDKNIIYLFSNKGQMTQIDINTKKFTIIKKLRIIGSYASSIVVNSKVHIVGGSKSGAHLLWNPVVKALKQVKKSNFVSNSGLIYIAEKNILLFFGEIVEVNSKNRIHKYDFSTNEWSTAGTIPNNMQRFGYVVVGNEQRYLTLLGGNSSKIIVMDLENMEKMNSTLSCPISGNFRAVLMDNSARAAIILVAFIRKYFDEKNNRIPEDVFNLMVMWILSHEIHLLSQKNGAHWRIDADEILESVGVGV